LLENAIGDTNINISVNRDSDCICLHGNSSDIFHLQQLPSISDNLYIDSDYDSDVDGDEDEDEDEDEYINTVNNDAAKKNVGDSSDEDT